MPLCNWHILFISYVFECIHSNKKQKWLMLLPHRIEKRKNCIIHLAERVCQNIYEIKRKNNEKTNLMN